MASIITPLEDSRVYQLRSSCSGHSEVWQKFADANHCDPNTSHVSLYNEEWWGDASNRDRVAFTFKWFIDQVPTKPLDIVNYVRPEWIDDVKERILDVERFQLHHRPTNHSKW